MKALKSILLLGLFWMISLGASAEVYSGSCGSNAKWSLDTTTGLLSITGSGDMRNYESYIDYAPWYSFRSDIKSLSIGDQITSIGDMAFYRCSGLTSVTIPNSVTSIGYAAFEYCLGLTSMTIPNSVIKIGIAAFSGCSDLISVTIPNSVTSIGSYAFSDCSGLTSVTIPNSVIKIGDNAFSNCSGLTSVTIGNSVNEIGEEAFAQCSGLTSVIIPNSVTAINAGAFSNCSGLINITIPNSVIKIGYSTFLNCSRLTSVTIPNSVTSIGSSAFQGCSSLTSMTIPNSVTLIDVGVFLGCSDLISVTIPNSVTSIGSSAFSRCSGLTSVTIPNSVISIGSYAFDGCLGLISMTIPNSVTSIGSSAFQGCSSLTSVTIGNSVTSIGKDTFRDCSGLTMVNITDLDKWAEIEFDSYRANPLSCTHNLYLNEQLVTEANLTTAKKIGNYAFYDYSDLKSVTIPNSVTSIGDYAFSGCSGLTSMSIPNSVISIGDYALSRCDKIAKIEYYANCQYRTGFSSLSSLKEVIIGDLMTILNTSFSGCKNLTKLTLGKSLQLIRQDVFSGCSSLKEVHSRAETPPILYSNVFQNVPLASATLYVPVSAKTAYSEADTWKDFGTIVSDTPAPVMHKIYIEVSKYGKVTYLGNNVTDASWDGNFEEGESIVLEVTPNDGAKLTKLLVNGMNMTSQVKDNQLTLEGMETDVAVKATFETETVTLTIATSEGTEKIIDVEYGAQFTFMLSQYADNVEKVVFNDVDVTLDVVTEEVAFPLWQLDMHESSDECSIQKYTTPAITTSSRIEVTYKLNHPLGDVNLDGSVNVNDITKTAEIILLRAKAEMEAKAAMEATAEP